MYAVLKIGGKQYKVSTDQKFKVEQISKDVGEQIVFNEVLAVGEGESIQFGAPHLSNAIVKASIIAHGRGPKITIFKKRRRKHYEKHAGHRQNYTQLQITEISA